MSVDEQTIRERIFHATLACIERGGINSLTVRGIAKEAGVNTAAINYYFGTKDNLVSQVLATTLTEGMSGSLDEFEQLIQARQGDIRTAVYEFLTLYFGQMTNWPRLTEAQLHDALTKQDYDCPAVAEANRFFERFLEIVRPILPERPEAEHRIAMLHLWLPMMFLAMLPRAFETFAEGGPHESEWRQAYVKQLLDKLLANPAKPSQFE